jgi:hypothetical protein
MESDKKVDAVSQIIKNELLSRDYSIFSISKTTMAERIDEIMELVNGVRNEYAKDYHWTAETNDYYFKEIPGKWHFSQMITHQNRIVFVNISSLQNDIVHFHGSYTHRNYRGRNLATYHMAFISNLAIEAGVHEMEGYWPKHNNGSLILHLRLGWKIHDLRKNGEQLFLKCNVKDTLGLSLQHLKLL